jgi:tRNA(Ile)-lysidine synthase
MRNLRLSRYLSELHQGLQRCELRGTRLLLAISGGADSVALLRGALKFQREFGLSLQVAHLNHQLRGADSDADADWVEALCHEHQVQVVMGVGRVIGGGVPGGSGTGIEEAARVCRHDFLERTAVETGSDVIVTAHTADDQSETVLHHLFRGTGLAGLRGIPWVRSTPAGIRLARPMLAIRRETLEEYLVELRQNYRTDWTNADTALTRNWLRHKLLPDLRERFGPAVDAAISRLAEQASVVEQTLVVLANRLLNEALLDLQADAVRIDSRKLADQPIHLVREVFRAVWQRQQWPRQGMGFSEWNRVAEVALLGGDIHLPGSIRARQHPQGLLILEKTNRQTAVRS